MEDIINKSKYRLLKAYFGHDNFKGGQEEVINSIINGTDTLTVMPTGSGKSLCFQLPALMMSGITIVVSPLIALMYEQVSYLNEIGIRAVYINSSLEWTEIEEIFVNIASGMYKMIYVAPERLIQEKFLSQITKVDISVLVVDEAHCISQWGNDFRPDYGKITEFVDKLENRPVIAAFTATATKPVREDIISSLQLRNCTEIIMGFDRKNLYFEVLNPLDKFIKLCDIIESNVSKPMIVYCLTRATVEDVYDRLTKKGILASKYHAGMSPDERKINQNDFQSCITNIMIATNAYGMGIDKPDIAVIVHYNMPKSIENYYQEAGRAGRNGCESRCIILYSTSDIRLNSYLIDKNSYNNVSREKKNRIKKESYNRLSAINHYCMTSECLRKTLLNYFDEKSADSCGKCSNCLKKF